MLAAVLLLAGRAAADPPVEVEVEARPAAGVEEVVVAVQEQAPEVFDQLVFPRVNEQSARQDLDVQLTMRISDLERVCQLTPAQVQKLRLAGQTDIKRLFDLIAAARRKFEGQRKDPRQLNAAFQELQSLRRHVTGLSFQDGSMFDKVARTLLTAEQAPRYQEQLRQRRQFRRRAQRDLFLLMLDREIPLRAKQRDQLEKLLERLPSPPSGQYELYALWFSASKLPADEYEAILDAAQWNTLQARFAPMQNMEPGLRQVGALGDEEAEE